MRFDANSVLVTSAVVFALMALAVWTLLHRRHHRLPVALWTLGGLGLGVSWALVALGTTDALQVQRHMLADAIGYAALSARVLALRHDLGLPLHRRRVLLAWALAVAVMLALRGMATPPMFMLYTRAVYLGGVGTLAWHAWRAGRAGPSRSGHMLAAVEALLCAALALRIGVELAHWAEGWRTHSWDYTVLTLVAAWAALYSNLAYVGMVLDRSRNAETAARLTQQAETRRRQAADEAAVELRRLLQQRDRLAAERDRLLQVLAHEIRQPLHNAGGALQAVARTLQSPATDKAPAAISLLRAQAVLSDVSSVLDNTLAAATLLSRNQPLALQDIDVQLLLDLAIGDLPQAQRQRVDVVYGAGIRSAEIEPGLVRLALRNLLRNAFGHGGPSVAVRLHVEEAETPPALLISVLDDGPGVAAAHLQQPPDGQPQQPPVPARGLGLAIVRRVMALHGGHLLLTARQPRGLQATLAFALPAADEPGT